MPLENLIIYTYNNSVTTAKAIQNDLDCRRIASGAPGAARDIPPNSLIVNWGYGYMPSWAEGKRVRYLNHPRLVARKMSKVYQLEAFRKAGVPTFDVTTSANTVRQWLNNGERVLCRQEEGARGLGITVIEGFDVSGRVPGADFYTKWVDKTHEYRVHIFQGKCIDLVQKKRLNDAKPFNQLTLTEQTVRNHANGWIEAHFNLHLPGDAREQLVKAAIGAVAALDLDFGAVDIIAKYSGPGQRRLEQIAVCEVNTAPGCGETEREAYVEAIKAAFQGE